jgi:hypothetical protein
LRERRRNRARRKGSCQEGGKQRANWLPNAQRIVGRLLNGQLNRFPQSCHDDFHFLAILSQKDVFLIAPNFLKRSNRGICFNFWPDFGHFEP